MIPIKFFNPQEKQELLKHLKEQFGVNEIPWNLAKWGKERIIILPKEISKKEIESIDDAGRVENIGLYFAKEDIDGVRLSIEGSNLLKNQITKNIFEMDEKQLKNWMLGQQLDVPTEKRGFLVMKYKDDFLGTGKASENRITNFVPKSRRLKSKEI
ncbi:MAG: hypothetical protein NTU63_01125 [Candidatus Pacearchaeota archaeon]|nr:hypothetical protein [Candidatus Pacearchaeota archaeon]